MWRRRRDVHRALSPQEVGALDSFCLGDKLKFKLECLVSEALGAAMTRRAFILGGAGLVFTHVILGDLGVARSDSAVDRLSLPESIEFNGESYRLSWSSHPKPDYYKQEYLPSGQTSERFQRMVLIEAIVRGVDINDAVAAKVSMLNKRKSTDPTVNFAVVKNPKNNEIILDFILSAEDPKGDDIVEWNAYRYAASTLLCVLTEQKNPARCQIFHGVTKS
jgi:hypothetical protein